MADNNNIDDLFKSGLDNKSVKAPSGAWAGIEQGLQAKKNNKKFVLLIIAALLLALFTGGVSYYLGKTAGTGETKYVEVLDTVFIEKVITKENINKVELSGLQASINSLEAENSSLKSIIKNRDKKIAAVNAELQFKNWDNLKVEPIKGEEPLVGKFQSETGFMPVLKQKLGLIGIGVLKSDIKGFSNSISTKNSGFKDIYTLGLSVGNDQTEFLVYGYNNPIGSKLDGKVSNVFNYSLNASISYQFAKRFSVISGVSYNCHSGQIEDFYENTSYYSVDAENATSDPVALGALDTRSIEGSFTNLEDAIWQYNANNTEVNQFTDSAGNIYYDSNPYAFNNAVGRGKFRTKYKFQYLEIPFTLRYYAILKRKWKASFEVGGSASLFSTMNKKSNILDIEQIQNDVQTKVQHFAAFNYLSFLNVDYSLSDRLELEGQLGFKATLKAPRHNIYAENFSSSTIRLGIRYMLSK
jgi:hypothetical protein